MTAPQSTTPAAPSLGRGMLGAARYYLGNRWALLALGGLAIGIGMYLGGWGWLVAVGAAPIILSVLPCLIMCGFGACMMCRSGKKEPALPLGAADTAISASALAIAKIEAPPVAGSSCCHDDGRGNSANALAAGSTTQWTEKTHA